MEKQAITLKIAGRSYPLNIDREKEEVYRLAEREVNAYLAQIKQNNIKNWEETDYLAISGARFPDIPTDELVAFNKATLKPDMTEADEFDRYRKIATFFHRR